MPLNPSADKFFDGPLFSSMLHIFLLSWGGGGRGGDEGASLTKEWWIVADAASLAVVWPGSAASALALPSCQSRG
jgi:hypothetical protein